MLSNIKAAIAWVKTKWGAVEAKVKAAGLWALLASVAVELLTNIHDTGALLGSLDPTVRFVVLAAIPPVVTFLGAYAARHTHRPDLEG